MACIATKARPRSPPKQHPPQGFKQRPARSAHQTQNSGRRRSRPLCFIARGFVISYCSETPAKMSPPSSIQLPLYKTFAASAVAACTAEVRSSTALLDACACVLVGLSAHGPTSGTQPARRLQSRGGPQWPLVLKVAGFPHLLPHPLLGPCPAADRLPASGHRKGNAPAPAQERQPPLQARRRLTQARIVPGNGLDAWPGTVDRRARARRRAP